MITHNEELMELARANEDVELRRAVVENENNPEKILKVLARDASQLVVPRSTLRIVFVEILKPKTTDITVFYRNNNS